MEEGQIRMQYLDPTPFILDTNTYAGPMQEEKGNNMKQSTQHCDAHPSTSEEQPGPLKFDKKKEKNGLAFHVEDNLPFHMAIFYSFQLTFINLFGSVPEVIVLHRLLCGGRDYAFLAKLMSSTIFMNGLANFLMVTIGVRIPVLQGSAFIYIPPIIAVLTTDTWKCPNLQSFTSVNDTSNATMEGETDLEHVWGPRLLMVSGSLLIASVVHIVIGLTGIVGFMMNFVGPLTLAPTIIFVCIQLFPLATTSSQEHWGIALLTVFLILLFSVILGNVTLPTPNWTRQKGFHFTRFPLLRMYSSLLAFAICWVLCYILTITDRFPNNKNDLGYLARTDAKLDAVTRSRWFVFPYPGQFGLPTFNVGLIVGFLATIIASIMDSIADYYATLRVCELKVLPKHALNRGIAMEGFFSLLSGLLGTCHGTTSYSSAMGFITFTGVASRTLWILMSIILMIFGIIGPLAGGLASIPEPIIGGLLIVALGLLISTAISQLENVKLTLVRNQFVLGVAFMLGLMLPQYIKDHSKTIQSGNEDFDLVVTVFLSTAAFVVGVIALILDNILPGSKKDRGMAGEQVNSPTEGCENHSRLFDLPFCTDRLRHVKIFSFLPFLPCYQERPCPCSCCSSCKRRDSTIKETCRGNRHSAEDMLGDKGNFQGSTSTIVSHI